MDECASCGYELTPATRKGVPGSVCCCKQCWNKVAVADRLRIGIAIRDRSPGGALAELAEVLLRTVEIQRQANE